ncbi:hypothetical protein [Fodinicola acaciae]|uniref:hypothetical protein n=1 Tax=Fodinicola acaciae TaxID=2681555 RepID=UPI0013D000F1|nr:hypothetical protein [Fodinicola acaciae]
MSIREALLYARRREHDHEAGKIYIVPDGLRLDDEIEVKHLISMCKFCAQHLHALGLYVDGEHKSTTKWISNGEAARAGWKARNS